LLGEAVSGKSAFFYKGIKKYDLIIFDDLFPHPISGFRLEEITVLLTTIPKSKVIAEASSYPIMNTHRALHAHHVKDYIEEHSEIREKIKFNRGFVNLNTKLFYCIFINNIFSFIDILEKNKTPFVFTLYPGGGFRMNNKESDRKLNRVLGSPMFRKVIVTQKITKDYLVANAFCLEEKIEFIFGCVVPQISLEKNSLEKKTYPLFKDTLDIGFCAGKYMPKGLDKGYDVFIELAHLLSAKYKFVNFHIIGGFDENDIDITKIKDNVTFYGYRPFEELQYFFSYIDILVSPNKSFVLNEGSFDGFPLGTVIEAALNGVLAVVTDDLKQNSIFINNKHLLIVESNSSKIENAITYLINNPDKFADISINGKSKFQEVYSNSFQMNPRVKLLTKLIQEHK